MEKRTRPERFLEAETTGDVSNGKEQDYRAYRLRDKGKPEMRMDPKKMIGERIYRFKSMAYRHFFVLKRGEETVIPVVFADEVFCAFVANMRQALS